MLLLERTGQAYSKTEHRRQLAKKLNGRSDGAIERKHQYISYVLLQLNCPPIDGYKPLSNYQALLFDVVSDQIKRLPSLEADLSAAVLQPATTPSYPDYSSKWTDAPKRSPQPRSTVERGPDVAKPWHIRLIQRDYLQRESLNRSLGEDGELLVMDLERWRLVNAGQPNLAAKVLHVSRDMGDGAGFDIRSFDQDGTQRFIEVKTTAFVRETPFFATQREVEFSAREYAKYSIYPCSRWTPCGPARRSCPALAPWSTADVRSGERRRWRHSPAPGRQHRGSVERARQALAPARTMPRRRTRRRAGGRFS
jgi:hypothetical protein